MSDGDSGEPGIVDFQDRNIQYYSGAMTTLLLYHYILTFEQERRYAWKNIKSLPFFLFLFIRYIPPLLFLIDQGIAYLSLQQFNDAERGETHTASFVEICEMGWIRIFVSFLVLEIAGVILILRVYALYPKNRKVLALMVGAFVGQSAAALTSVILDTSTYYSFRLYSGPSRVFTGCPQLDPLDQQRGGFIYTSTRTWYFRFFFWMAFLFDGTIFILTAYKAFHTNGGDVPKSSLLRTIFRDGNLYFGAISSVNLLFFVLINASKQTVCKPKLSADVWLPLGIDCRDIPKYPGLAAYVGPINVQFSAVVTAVVVSSLFLNLREAAHRSRMAYSMSSEGMRSMDEWRGASRGAASHTLSNPDATNPGPHTTESAGSVYNDLGVNIQACEGDDTEDSELSSEAIPNIRRESV